MDFYQDELFKTLVTQLLNEPFALEQDLKNLDLASACKLTQEARESLAPQTDSLENVRALLLLVLCHLDLTGLTDFPRGKLGNFVTEEPSSKKIVAALLKAEAALNEAKAELSVFPDFSSVDKKAA